MNPHLCLVTLLPAFVITMPSLCHHYAQPLSSLCSAFVITMPSLCHRYAQPLSSLCPAFVIAMPSLCYRYAQPLSSLCPAFVITMPSLCHRYAHFFFFFFSIRKSSPAIICDTLVCPILTFKAGIRDRHSRTPGNGKSTRIVRNSPRVRAQSHATKRYLAVEGPQVTRVERIKTGPILCGVRLCYS